MKNKNNPLYLIENHPRAQKEKKEIFNDTVKYQRKYGFEKGTGEHATHNNEADAFKHAYWQAREYVFDFPLGIAMGNFHEMSNPKQPKGELNMDLWNYKVGQEIGKEAANIIGNMKNLFTDEQIKDYIAELVMQRMRAGDLITNPDDPRKFEDYDKIKARQNKLAPKYDGYYQQCRVPIHLLKNKRGFYRGFTNDENGSDRIYSVEDVGAMSDEEYATKEKVLKAQISKIGLPSNYELKKAHSNGDVYVHSYTKDDGTHVKQHYRSYPNR